MRTTIYLILMLLLPLLLFKLGLIFLSSLLDAINSRLKEDLLMAAHYSKRCVASFIICFLVCIIISTLFPMFISLFLSLCLNVFWEDIYLLLKKLFYCLIVVISILLFIGLILSTISLWTCLNSLQSPTVPIYKILDSPLTSTSL